MMHLAALISGGKDSALALHRILEQGHNVDVLVTMIPLKSDSWMFHYPTIKLVDFFAKAARIPIITEKTSGIKEEELGDLKRVISKLDVEGIVTGAIESKYQKQRIETICAEFDLLSIMPLWGNDPLTLLKELVNSNFEVIITGVSAQGFDSEWLGKKINSGTIQELIELNEKHHISIIGEGGEYETLVLDAPFFCKKIKPIGMKKIWKGQSGHLLIKKARLIPKDNKEDR